MPEFAQRLVGKVGLALGIVVIVGSVVGGVVLAADLWRAGEQADTGVPVSNEGAATPSDTGAPSGSAPTVSPGGASPTVSTPPPAVDGAPTSVPPGGPATTPAPDPTPTCWTGSGERPDGIEKCEDN